MAIISVLPAKFSFPRINDFWYELGPFVDGLTVDARTPTYLNDLEVRATLYDGRSLTDPEHTPGTAVTGFDDIALEYVPGSKALYRGPVEEAFNPAIKSGYVVVISAVRDQPNDAVGEWEIPADVVRNK